MLHPRGKMKYLIVTLLGVFSLMGQDLSAESRTIIMGGDNGLPWMEGGGSIAAAVQTGPTEVEFSNTPGNVIEFGAEKRTGWLSPQEADDSKNIALGLISRGGRLGAPTILSQDIKAGLLFMVDNDPTTAFERKTARGGAQVPPCDARPGCRGHLEAPDRLPRNQRPMVAGQPHRG